MFSNNNLCYNSTTDALLLMHVSNACYLSIINIHFYYFYGFYDNAWCTGWNYVYSRCERSYFDMLEYSYQDLSLHNLRT